MKPEDYTHPGYVKAKPDTARDLEDMAIRLWSTYGMKQPLCERTSLTPKDGTTGLSMAADLKILARRLAPKVDSL